MKNLILTLALLLLPISQASASANNAFLSGNFGILMTSNPDGDAGMEPSWGLQLGMELFDVKFAKLAPTLAFEQSGLDFGFLGSLDEMIFTAQGIFRKVENTGFYFGPEFGVAVLTTSVGNGFLTASSSYFTYGALAGYEFNTEGLISFGPEVHIVRFSAATSYEYLARLSLNF